MDKYKEKDVDVSMNEYLNQTKSIIEKFNTATQKPWGDPEFDAFQFTGILNLLYHNLRQVWFSQTSEVSDVAFTTAREKQLEGKIKRKVNLNITADIYVDKDNEVNPMEIDFNLKYRGEGILTSAVLKDTEVLNAE